MQPVAGLDLGRAARQERLVAADDHVHERVARQVQLAHHVARDRVALAARELHHLGAQPADRADLHQRPRHRGLVGGQPQRARQPLERDALDERRGEHDEEDDVEESSRRAGRPRSPGRSRARSGPRRAGRPSRAAPTRAGRSRTASVADEVATGRATNIEHRASSGPRRQVSPNSAREHEQAEHEEHRDLADPGEAVVEVDDGPPRRDLRAAQHEAGDVDREEAGAVQRRRRRRMRAPPRPPTRPGRARASSSRHALERPARPASRPRARPAAPIGELRDEEQSMSSTP